MGLPQARAALENGSADCALLAGPLAYQEEQKGMHVVTTGDGLVSGLTVTATSGKFYKEHKELVDLFLSVQKETLTYMKDHQKKPWQLPSKRPDLMKKPLTPCTVSMISAWKLRRKPLSP